ncbi:MAG: sulfurtransferase [Pseudomonadota bacterium]|nr:sulfurtransferase [Pseudomonadota bacterium]
MTESALVDVGWLFRQIGDEKLVVLDASVPPVVPGFVSINNENNFTAIADARRFDYDQQVCKSNTTLPHMMPSAALFQEKVRALGINNEDTLVVYDDVGLYASPRAWWMFKAMGHENVFVLDGGLPAWLADSYPVTDALAEAPGLGNFAANEQEGLFCDFEMVLAAIDDKQKQIVDARSAGRFAGTAPEPRPGVRGGHMPSARNLPFPDVLEEGRLRPPEELRRLFLERATPEQQVITSCGSGITACVLTLAAWELGYRNLSVYDGSWAEWGAPSHLPVVS